MGTGALVVTAFVSVAREGIETALFVWPAVQAAGSGWGPLAGVFLGLSVAFDVSGVIAPDGFIGALLRGIFNLHPTTSWAQAFAWLLYVVPVIVLFLLPAHIDRSKPGTRAGLPLDAR